MVGAEEIRADDVVRAGVQAREHRGLGRALDERVDRHRLLEVARLANVAVDERDARLAQARQVQLRPAPLEVVEREELPVGVAVRQREATGSRRRSRRRP